MNDEIKDNENICKECGHNWFEHQGGLTGCTEFVPDKDAGASNVTSCGCKKLRSH